MPPGVLKVKLILPSGCQRGLTSSFWTHKMSKSTPNHSQHDLLTTGQHQSSAVLRQCPSTHPGTHSKIKLKEFTGKFIGIKIHRNQTSENFMKPNSVWYYYSCASTFSAGWEADFIAIIRSRASSFQLDFLTHSRCNYSTDDPDDDLGTLKECPGFLKQAKL